MRSRVGAGLAVLAVVLAGCGTDSADGRGSAESSAPAPDSKPTGASPTPDEACPAAYAEPDPQRPKITLDFQLSDDLRTVRGAEEVRFVADRTVTELVFRLTPNGPTNGDDPSSVRVTSARSGSSRPFTVEPAGARDGTQGGLLVIPLAEPAAAGKTVTARVEFTLTLGDGVFERFGQRDGYAWWGSGQPLFAWERGEGWHREPLASFIGESATSEAADVDLTVTAPAGLTVLSSGVQDDPADAGADRRRWHSRAETSRDVSVAVGSFETATQRIGGTEVTVGAASQDVAEDVMKDTEFSVEKLAEFFGPFPYPSLTLARVPADGGGIEYPGAILLMGEDRELIAHEVAHEWFYGMVGNSQARDPWLDEAFATYGERLTSGDTKPSGELAELPGEVGDAMADFDTAFGQGGYFDVVYNKGSEALITARDTVGPRKFDTAMRCYVNANAWTIAQPDDLADALAGLPEAVRILERARALP